MSKIIGYRLLLIPRKQTRRLCPGILSTRLHFPWQNKYFEASALLSPWRSIYIQDKISFLHFTFLDSCMWYFPLGISNRATRKASAQCTVTALLLRWQAPVGNQCPLIRGLVARSFLTWKTLFSLLSRSKSVVWSVCNLMGALSSQWSSLNTVLSHLSRSVQWERITAARPASPRGIRPSWK